MRALVAASFALILMLSAVPAEAKLLPKTRGEAQGLVRDVLEDTDASGAKMLRAARKMVRGLQETAPPVPDLPTTEQGTLEIRTTLVQPGVRGKDMMLGALWVGASRAYWTGVYWIESDVGGQKAPQLLDVNENGLLLFVDGGSLAPGASLNVTYHFLGANGKHVVHALGEIALLETTPVLDRIDVGGAVASSGEEPDVLFLTPWNLYDHNVTAGVSILAGDEVLDEETMTACGDWEAEVMEPGCRLLYAFPFDRAATSLRIWSLGADGERRIEREISRSDLLDGVTFAG